MFVVPVIGDFKIIRASRFLPAASISWTTAMMSCLLRHLPTCVRLMTQGWGHDRCTDAKRGVALASQQKVITFADVARGVVGCTVTSACAHTGTHDEGVFLFYFFRYASALGLVARVH